MPVPAIDKGLGDPDALGRELVVIRVLRCQDGVNAREQQAGRDLRFDRQK